MDLSAVNPATYGLTEGIISVILNQLKPTKPRVQLLDFKEIGNKGEANAANKRYRLMISDGRNKFAFAMISSQMVHLIDDGTISNFAIIELEEYVCNIQQQNNTERKILIITQMSLVQAGQEVGGIIGTPTQIPDLAGNQNGHVAMQPASVNNPLNQGAGVKRPLVPNQNNRNESPKRGPAAQQNSANFGSNFQQQEPSFPGSSPARTQNGGRTGSMPVDNEGFVEGGPVPQNIHPISALTQYQNRWTIRAVVKSKDSVRNWSNARGSGQLAGLWLEDESGEIKATMFGADVEKYHATMEQGKTYYIRGAQVKPADRKFNSRSQFELTFRTDTLVRLAHETVVTAPPKFKFVKINKIPDLAAESIIDVAGVLKSVRGVEHITSKTGKDLIKRELEIMDDSGCMIKLTLWANKATEFEGNEGDVLVAQRCKISDFGGKSLGIINDSDLYVNADIPESNFLLGWYNATGKTASVTALSSSGGSGGGLSPFKTIEEADSEVQTNGGNPVAFSTRATVMRINRPEQALYQACTNMTQSMKGDKVERRMCNKKVVPGVGGGEAHCPSCNTTGVSVAYRFMVSVEIADCSGNAYVTLFQEQAEKVLGKSAEAMGHLFNTDPTAYHAELNKIQFKSYLFKMRAQMSTYQDNTSLKHQVWAADVVDFAKHTELLQTEYKKLRG